MLHVELNLSARKQAQNYLKTKDYRKNAAFVVIFLTFVTIILTQT